MTLPLFLLSDDSLRHAGEVGVPLRMVRAAPAPAAPGVDDALVARLRTGDEEALGELFHEHYARLCTYAFRLLGSADLAESAVLDVMTSLWERRATIEIHGTLRAYLTGAVRMRAANIARAQRVTGEWERRAASEDVVPGMSTTIPTADVAATTHDIERAILTAAQQLPPRCRDVFALAWYAGLTYAEIAAQLGISVKGVEAQMSRAYRSLRTALAAWRD